MRVIECWAVGTHPDMLRSGEPAQVIGVHFIVPTGSKQARPCFQVRFPDGEIDWWTLEDWKAGHFELREGPP